MDRREAVAVVKEVLGKLLWEVCGEVVWSGEEDSGAEELPIRMAALGVRCEVLVSALESPALLWLQLPGSRTIRLNQLNSSLTRHCSQPEVEQVEEVEVGQVVAARFGAEGGFYRAKVVAIIGEQVELFYVDYGDWDIQGRAGVRPLLQEFRVLRHQAVRCRLAGVAPRVEVEVVGGDGWGEEAVEELATLTRCAEGRVGWATLVDWCMEGGLLVPCVRLEVQGRDVGEEMVRRRYAVCTVEYCG